MNPNYIDTVRLLLAIAPAVFASGRFAMRHRAEPVCTRDAAPVGRHRLGVRRSPSGPAGPPGGDRTRTGCNPGGARGQGLPSPPAHNAEGDDVKLVVGNDTAQVKVEVNFVFRGTVLPVEPRRLVASAQDLFTTDLAVPILASAELYGSKLVAAMDRQHPRDIFDVMHMLDQFGWRSHGD